MKTNPIINSSVYKSNPVNESCSKKKLTTKWDKCLDDYENYMIEYIKQYKKSLKGNIDAMCKYPYMKAKVLALSEQLNKAQQKDLLTEKQIKRKSKIQIKRLYKCCI